MLTRSFPELEDSFSGKGSGFMFEAHDVWQLPTPGTHEGLHATAVKLAVQRLSHFVVEHCGPDQICKHEAFEQTQLKASCMT